MKTRATFSFGRFSCSCSVSNEVLLVLTSSMFYHRPKKSEACTEYQKWKGDDHLRLRLEMFKEEETSI